LTQVFGLVMVSSPTDRGSSGCEIWDKSLFRCLIGSVVVMRSLFSRVLIGWIVFWRDYSEQQSIGD